MERMQVEHPSVRGMSAEERMEAALKVSIQNPDHLKRWLEASGRRWLVVDTSHLVDALPWPDGVSSLTQILAAYRDHRATLPTGEVVHLPHPVTGEHMTAPVFHDEVLEVYELDRVIRFLVGQITEKDESWALTNDPL